MPAPLIPVEILSIYFVHHNRVKLPDRMAKCTPDMKQAVLSLREDLKTRGIDLFLSDMFRSHDEQLQAHNDNAQKGTFSPLPGGSLHESGRAFDLDLETLLKDDLITLKQFWEIARPHGLVPIIGIPDRDESEAWHFECRGSHAKVREYYKNGKGDDRDKAYVAMAESSIVSVGIKVDRFQNRQKAAAIQSALIRLDHELGALDGSIGNKTKAALAAAGVPFTDEDTMLAKLEEQLRQKFPGEFQT
jgi:D-alanyl-D-alanine dipeptidase